MKETMRKHLDIFPVASCSSKTSARNRSNIFGTPIALALSAVLVISIFLTFPVFGNQQEAYQSGKFWASSQAGDVANLAKTANPQTIPGFQTEKSKESSLDFGTIGEAALQESKTNSVSQHLISQVENRPVFKIDPNNEPLFKEANKLLKDPQQALQDEFVETTGTEDNPTTLVRCEESGEEYQQTCSRRLEIELKVIPEQGYTTPKWCIEHWKNKYRGTKYKCEGCRGGDYLITQHKQVIPIREEWVDGCKVLESHLEKGLCRYTNIIISPKDETRIIQGEPVTRDHFEEHYHYACFKTSPKSCAGLREKGCYQVKSACKEKSGNQCILWEQTFNCPSGKASLKTYRSSSKENPFCLTGNCADTSYEANGEMLNVMGHLYALRAAQNELRDFKVMFKGTARGCTRNCLNFRDCCGNDQGWGVALHLSNCDKDEKELRELRDKKLCVQVGTHCVERDKVFKTCLRKKTMFCCYGTKLSRLIQETARKQLGVGFGNPQQPDCSGLSADQLSRVDLSKADFTDLFAEIQSQTVLKGQQQFLAKVSSERLQENMSNLTKPSQNFKDKENLKGLREKGF